VRLYRLNASIRTDGSNSRQLVDLVDGGVPVAG
jgi:hypothetical protein